MEKAETDKKTEGSKARESRSGGFAGTGLLILIIVAVCVFGWHNIVGDSMEPACHDGQKVITVKAFTAPSRGDIVVAYSSAAKKLLIKRVAGVPGDSILVTLDGEVYVNGEPYEYGTGNGVISTMDGMRQEENGDYSVTLGKGEFFLLGDNLENSGDSRILGAFKRRSILEKVFFIF